MRCDVQLIWVKFSYVIKTKTKNKKQKTKKKKKKGGRRRRRRDIYIYIHSGLIALTIEMSKALEIYFSNLNHKNHATSKVLYLKFFHFQL